VVPVPGQGEAWAGFKEHAFDWYNIGAPPYGYRADRIPHPAPGKAAQGRTKTRLAPDPVRAPVIAQIFAWRTVDRLAVRSIAALLNADPQRYPPPGQYGWQPSTVARILANPKYTGYMVYGRRRSQAGKRCRPVPQDAWLWSPSPRTPLSSPAPPGTPRRPPPPSTPAAATRASPAPTPPPAGPTRCGP